MDSFKQSTNLTAMEPTRKSTEGIWILVTTTTKLYNARIEADKVLSRFIQQSRHSNRPINHNPN